MKQLCLMSLVIGFLLVSASFGEIKMVSPEQITGTSKNCIECHQKTTPGLYNQWKDSAHPKANVGCWECHHAEKGESDAISHHGEMISIIVSPRDCSKCHPKEAAQFAMSAHADAACLVMDAEMAAFFIKYVLNLSGENAFKSPGFPNGVDAAGVNGCYKCHGTEVRFDDNGKFDPATWPNTGMGRVNPDGTKGNCAACHMSHEFSRTQARQPESCSVCHSISTGFYGYQIFEGSRHGISYATNKDKMHLDSTKWIVGETYSAAPTCATCHMASTKTIDSTHNISERRLLPWVTPLTIANISGIESCPKKPGRAKMDNICLSCHNTNFVENFKLQVKSEQDLYTTKWLNPGKTLYCKGLDVYRALEGDKYRPFTHNIDWAWFGIGQTFINANAAVSMMSQQYTNYFDSSTTESWYNGFIPSIEAIITAGKESGIPDARKKALELEVLLEETLANKALSYGPGWPVDKDAAVTGCGTKNKQ